MHRPPTGGRMTAIDETIRDRLRALSGRPLAFEALWDGDSEGWRLYILAVLPGAGETYEARSVWTSNEPGGDFRIFRNLVPPWPEAEKAARIGGELSAEFGVPFHFPSPKHPEMDCPHWWELASSYPCKRCGIALLQHDPCPWRGTCSSCHGEEEREKAEALLSPEERAGPRCHVCGRPAAGSVRSRPRCARCLKAYEDYACSTCGGWTMIHRSRPHTEECSRCELLRRLAGLEPAQRDAIRNAAQREGTIRAIMVAHKLIGCDLSDASFAVQLLTKDAV
jgi:hypothetical protein